MLHRSALALFQPASQSCCCGTGRRRILTLSPARTHCSGSAVREAREKISSEHEINSSAENDEVQAAQAQQEAAQFLATFAAELHGSHPGDSAAELDALVKGSGIGGELPISTMDIDFDGVGLDLARFQ